MLKPGQENALIKKLDAAKKHLEKDRTRGACQKLNDFIDQVAFKNGRILTEGVATPLIDSANGIRSLISC